MSPMEVCLPSGSLCTCFGAAEFEATRLVNDRCGSCESTLPHSIAAVFEFKFKLNVI